MPSLVYVVESVIFGDFKAAACNFCLVLSMHTIQDYIRIIRPVLLLLFIRETQCVSKAAKNY